jgi:hypothetical protein
MASDNKLQNASNIGVLNAQRSFNGFVGQSDKVDSSKFSRSGRSSFSLSLSKLKANANIKLLDANGAVLAPSNQKSK